MVVRSFKGLDAYQAEVLEMLFERTAIAEGLEMFRFASASDVAQGRLVVTAPFIEERQQIALNLPCGSSSVFIALTNKEPEAVARMIVGLEDHERERGAPLSLGEAVITDGDSPDTEGPFAVLLARTAWIDALAEIPDTAAIAGHTTTFLLAVPLTRAEYDFRAAHGLDALFGRFEAEGKELAF
jgi:hypothetical protein